jgi:hypothetical protein
MAFDRVAVVLKPNALGKHVDADVAVAVLVRLLAKGEWLAALGTVAVVEDVLRFFIRHASTSSRATALSGAE